MIEGGSSRTKYFLQTKLREELPRQLSQKTSGRFRLVMKSYYFAAADKTKKRGGDRKTSTK